MRLTVDSGKTQVNDTSQHHDREGEVDAGPLPPELTSPCSALLPRSTSRPTLHSSLLVTRARWPQPRAGSAGTSSSSSFPSVTNLSSPETV